MPCTTCFYAKDGKPCTKFGDGGPIPELKIVDGQQTCFHWGPSRAEAIRIANEVNAERERLGLLEKQRQNIRNPVQIKFPNR